MAIDQLNCMSILRKDCISWPVSTAVTYVPSEVDFMPFSSVTLLCLQLYRFTMLPLNGSALFASPSPKVA